MIHRYAFESRVNQPINQETIVEVKELAQLVREMRDWQKQFFKGDRSPQTLGAAKTAERNVDRAVERILSPQKGLFEDDQDIGPRFTVG